MYEYKATVVKVIDGDTVDVDIDLGFGIVMKDERVRIMGIDTPESRTSDDTEKLFGEAAKSRVIELLGEGAILKTQINKDSSNMKGKFGRILGDFIVEEFEGQPRLLTEVLIEEHHAVVYMGGSKEEIEAAHKENRKWLIEHNKVEYNVKMDL
jgi:micrococcal nuclease